jgi:type I restriction enzyme S subunit
MNRMQAWSGMFAVSKQDGLVSPDYTVFRVSAGVELEYFEHLFKTPLYVEQFAQRSKESVVDSIGSIHLILVPFHWWCRPGKSKRV